MTIHVGGIDVFRQGLDSEYRITVLEMLFQEIANKHPDIITQEKLEQIRADALEILQEKYPSAGIKKRED